MCQEDIGQVLQVGTCCDGFWFGRYDVLRPFGFGRGRYRDGLEPPRRHGGGGYGGSTSIRVSAAATLCADRRTTDERTHEKFEIEMKVQSAGPGAGGKLNVIRARWKFTVNGNDAKAVGAGVGTEKSTEDQQSAAGFLG